MKITRIGTALIMAALLITACTVPEVVETPQPDGAVVLVTNQVVEPRIITAIETAKVVNTATAPVNPYSAIITAILGFATVAAGAWGTIATLIGKQKQGQIKTLVKGIEKAGSAETKNAIELQSAADGNKLALDSNVQKILN